MPKFTLKTGAMASGTCFALVMALTAGPAFASSANDIFGDASPIQKLTDFITGPFAFLIVIMAIVIVGALLIFGNDLSGFGRRMLLVVLAGGMILGATTVVSKLFNSGAAGASFAPGDLPPDWTAPSLIKAPNAINPQ